MACIVGAEPTEIVIIPSPAIALHPNHEYMITYTHRFSVHATSLQHYTATG